MVVKVGDNVLYGKYAGTEIELDGENTLIMRQADVFSYYLIHFINNNIKKKYNHGKRD